MSAPLTGAAAALLGAGLLLAGCAGTPVPERAALAPAAPAQWSATAATGPVQAGWLAAFGDAELLRLVDEAVAHNHDLRAAAARLDEAQAAAGQAAAALVPQVGLEGTTLRAGDMESTAESKTGAALTIAWELDVWGRVRAGATAGAARADAATQDYDWARVSLAAQTAKAWLQAIEAQQQQALARQALDNLAEMQRIVSARQREGLASGLDTHLLQTDLEVAGAREQETAAARRDAVRSLELLLGRYPAAELAVRAALPALPAPVPAGLPAQLLERRPDLRAAEARVIEAYALAREARAARLPRISLTGAGGSASNALLALLMPGDSFWYLGVNLFQPLIDGGRMQADVEIADARQRAAVAAYAGRVLQAFGEVEHSLDAGASLQQRAANLRAAAAQAAAAHRLAQLRYQAGESDLLDVLQLHQRVLEIEQSLARVELQQLSERINLHLALGGDFAVQE
ncbi:MAG: efflux transporter outer membrane subunit [Pseudomonadota bacterium]